MGAVSAGDAQFKLRHSQVRPAFWPVRMHMLKLFDACGLLEFEQLVDQGARKPLIAKV
jgi:hypothetical protein